MKRFHQFIFNTKTKYLPVNTSTTIFLAAPLTYCCFCLFSASATPFVSSSSTTISITNENFSESMMTTIDSKNISSSSSCLDTLLEKHQFEFAGYHGTSGNSQLCRDLKRVSFNNDVDSSSDDTRSNVYRLVPGNHDEETNTRRTEQEEEQKEKVLSTSWGGGELGSKGLYLSRDLNSALLFGASQATSSTTNKIRTDNNNNKEDVKDENEGRKKKVVLFEVWYDTTERWNQPPTIVRNSETFEKLPNSFESPPHDVLVVQNDGNNFFTKQDEKDRTCASLVALERTDGKMHLHSLLPSQYKVNSHKISSLLFVVKGIVKSAEEAFEIADQRKNTKKLSSETTTTKNNCRDGQQNYFPLPVLRVMPDGNCMFHSLSWHLKMNSEERGDWLKQLCDVERRENKNNNSVIFSQFLENVAKNKMRPNPQQYFGYLEKHMTKTMELKQELVNWMIAETKREKENSKIRETWDLITVFGEETSFFGGARTLDQYLTMLKRECDYYFSTLKSASFVPRRMTSTSVFADIQLFYPALQQLYPKNPVIVFTDRSISGSRRVVDDDDTAESVDPKTMMKPLVFCSSGNEMVEERENMLRRNLYPVELVFTWGSLHYDAVSWRGPFATRRSKL